MEQKSSFKSKKFVMCLLVVIGAFALKFNESLNSITLLNDWPFVALVVGTVVLYFFIQGNIDLSKVKDIVSDHFRLDIQDKDKKQG